MKMKTAPITVRLQPDKTLLLTAFAPRDGAGRQVTACDLSYPMTKEQFFKFVDELVMLRAGL